MDNTPERGSSQTHRAVSDNHGPRYSSKREWIFTLILALICILLVFLDLTNIPQAPGGIRCRALVTAVDNSRVRVNLIVKTNAQYLTVRLLDGPHRGLELPVVNMLTGKMELDEFYKAGTVILIEYSVRNGKPSEAIARGYYR